jgi:hypothetical protein
MIDVFVTGLWIYGGIGAAVALAFVLYGIDRIDVAAHGAYAVRPLLLPGLMILWPLVLIRWVALARQKDDTA